MAAFPPEMEVHFPRLGRAISARRLWEYTDRGQVNPFFTALSIDADASEFIDFLHADPGTAFATSSETIAVLEQRAALARIDPVDEQVLGSGQLARLKARVRVHIESCLRRRATRLDQPAFIPVDDKEGTGKGLGIKGLYSAIQRQLAGKAQRQSARQWLGTLKNLPGIRAEELALLVGLDPAERLTGPELAARLKLDGLWISIIPFLDDAGAPLRWTRTAPWKSRRTRLRHEIRPPHTRTAVFHEHALGYRIEQVDFDTFWGMQHLWQAVKYDGTVLEDATGQTAFDQLGFAVRLAEAHAQAEFPKRVAFGRWRSYTVQGGTEYREWLVTLPFQASSYRHERHFDMRNVLMHIRSDVREGVDGERILFVQELQSDWCQSARREEVPPPPFSKEWTTLGLKLILLHAAHRGLDGVAWTTGQLQAERWELGEQGLRHLYDRTLPAECDLLLRPFGSSCSVVEVYAPVDYDIQVSEEGYTVVDANGNAMGVADSFEEAQESIPDGAKDELMGCPGVMLSPELRAAILARGFPAWGFVP